jgi:hypothetical protein
VDRLLIGYHRSLSKILTRIVSEQEQEISMGEKKQRNEGEGNRTAARVYNEATEKFTKSDRVQKQAEQAKKAVDSEQRAELRQAERVGKSKARGEDPALKRKTPRAG